MSNEKIALIVGASRGLGLGLVREYLDRGWRVVATARGNDEALRALAEDGGDRLRVETLDVTDGAGVAALAAAHAGETLDVLFVSAGVTNDNAEAAGDVAPAEFARVMKTNALAPMHLIEALGGRVAPDGAIVAMTSVLGSVGANTSGGYEVYRASKAALNTLLRSYASRHKDRAVIAMHPGWVQTDMGGAGAPLTVDRSAKGMVDVIAARSGQPGCMFVDYQGKTIDW